MKLRIAPRMTYNQQIQRFQNLPKIPRFIAIMKITGVFLVAIDIQGIVTATWWMALLFIRLSGVVVPMMPIKIRAGQGIARHRTLAPGTAICPSCCTPWM
jgi:hypothetical protein